MSNKLIIKKTSDGTSTLYNKELDEHYHSIHGAVQESLHVFIKNGIEYFIAKYPSIEKINILEVGFGTGLNSFLSLNHVQNTRHSIFYTALEPHPVAMNLIQKMDFKLNKENDKIFKNIHDLTWEKSFPLTSNFSLNKKKMSLQDFKNKKNFQIVYFDAFGPRVENHLWNIDIFIKIYTLLEDGGVFVTYCAKGQVRRDLQNAGFEVERLPGPPGKREMLRGIKKL